MLGHRETGPCGRITRRRPAVAVDMFTPGPPAMHFTPSRFCQRGEKSKTRERAHGTTIPSWPIAAVPLPPIPVRNPSRGGALLVPELPTASLAARSHLPLALAATVVPLPCPSRRCCVHLVFPHRNHTAIAVHRRRRLHLRDADSHQTARSSDDWPLPWPLSRRRRALFFFDDPAGSTSFPDGLRPAKGASSRTEYHRSDR